MSDILTPELLNLLVTGAAGGFSAYHGVKIALYVLGKISEKRAKKRAEQEEQEVVAERKRFERVIGLVRDVLKGVGSANPSSPSPSPSPSPTPGEPDKIEELIAKVLKGIQK